MKRLGILLLGLVFGLAVSACGPQGSQVGKNSGGQQPGPGQFIELSKDGTHLVDANGKAVFLTGDSPQLLFVQINNANVDTYLADRAARGFNVLWVYPVDRVDQTNAPNNFFGNAPFDGTNFTNEDATYWAHVDLVVSKAQADGITMVMNAAFVGLTSAQGYFSDFNDSGNCNLFANYGTWLGNRYKGYPNIIWSLGGDADVLGNATIKANISCLGTALAAADPNHLITVETCRVCSPANQSSLDSYGGSPPAWLRLNWVYNTQPTVVQGCQNGFNASNTILPMMGEDWYELDSRVTPTQVRQEGYWEVLSGCFLGRLFGNDAILNFNGPSFPSPSWQSQLGSVGSVSQALMGKLFRSREHWKLQPDLAHTVVTAGFGSGSTITTTARASDGQSIIAYVPNGSAATLTVDMTKIASSNGQANCWWFNPSSGATALIGSFANSGTRNFTPPDSNDWVLVIDAASANLGPPGSSNL